jgi:hypothetical protein
MISIGKKLGGAVNRPLSNVVDPEWFIPEPVAEFVHNKGAANQKNQQMSLPNFSNNCL